MLSASIEASGKTVTGFKDLFARFFVDPKFLPFRVNPGALGIVLLKWIIIINSKIDSFDAKKYLLV